MPYCLSANRFVLHVLVLLSILGASLLWSQEVRLGREGDKPYAPTRLEWLAVNLNADLRVDLSESTGYSIDFVPLAGTGTILISVIYLPTVDRQIMNMSIDTARKIISSEANSRGWSSWLKVKEQVDVATSKDK